MEHTVTFAIKGSTVTVVFDDFRSAIDFVMDYADIIEPATDFEIRGV
jgi:hypothetical protein